MEGKETKLIIKAKFDAAHFIPDHPHCGKVHGHCWHLTVAFQPKITDAAKITVDFKVLKTVVRGVLDRLDHTLINDLIEIPSAENISSFIFQDLKSVLISSNVPATVSSVNVWETEECGVSYP